MSRKDKVKDNGSALYGKWRKMIDAGRQRSAAKEVRCPECRRHFVPTNEELDQVRGKPYYSYRYRCPHCGDEFRKASLVSSLPAAIMIAAGTAWVVLGRLAFGLHLFWGTVIWLVIVFGSYAIAEAVIDHIMTRRSK